MLVELVSRGSGLLDLGRNAETKNIQLAYLPQLGQQPITVVYPQLQPAI